MIKIFSVQKCILMGASKNAWPSRIAMDIAMLLNSSAKNRLFPSVLPVMNLRIGSLITVKWPKSACVVNKPVPLESVTLEKRIKNQAFSSDLNFLN